MFHPFAEVTIINVQQGDSILIRLPLNRENYLIDTGKPSQWNSVQTLLDAKGIKHLNALFITHSDNDHSGNMQNVINYYHPEYTITRHRDSFQNGKISFLDLNSIEDEDENRSSLVTYFSLNGLKFLCMGDSDSFSEKKITEKYGNLECDILKLSHHGSKTGSSEEFLDIVRPKIGLISSGPFNIYRHPSPEVIQRLLKRHIPFLDTKDDGDISIFCFFRWNLMITSTGKISLLN
ncbi:MAG: MBL fold metallo-hydrolase [Erysipelotrichia bacterium]|nr:MBL fold metallo-hydrolase [Erysipelotrichia bacterium]